MSILPLFLALTTACALPTTELGLIDEAPASGPEKGTVSFDVGDGLRVVRDSDTYALRLLDARGKQRASALEGFTLLPVRDRGQLLLKRAGSGLELFDVDRSTRAPRRLWSLEGARTMAGLTIVERAGELAIAFVQVEPEGHTSTRLARVRPGEASRESTIGEGAWSLVSWRGDELLLLRANAPLGPDHVGGTLAPGQARTMTIGILDLQAPRIRQIGEVPQCAASIAMGCCDRAWQAPAVDWSDAIATARPVATPFGAGLFEGQCDTWSIDAATRMIRRAR